MTNGQGARVTEGYLARYEDAHGPRPARISSVHWYLTTLAWLATPEGVSALKEAVREAQA